MNCKEALIWRKTHLHKSQISKKLCIVTLVFPVIFHGEGNGDWTKQATTCCMCYLPVKKGSYDLSLFHREHHANDPPPPIQTLSSYVIQDLSDCQLGFFVLWCMMQLLRNVSWLTQPPLIGHFQWPTLFLIYIKGPSWCH